MRRVKAADLHEFAEEALESMNDDCNEAEVKSLIVKAVNERCGSGT